MNSIRPYKDLIVWQKSILLVEKIYEITEKFPKEEIFGLTSQMRWATISIPSNIAEGTCRSTRKDYKHFLHNSYASGAELETQIIISKRLKKTRMFDYREIDVFLLEIQKMLNKMISNLGVCY